MGRLVQPTADRSSSSQSHRSRYAVVPSAKAPENIWDTYCPSAAKSVMANSTQPMIKHRQVYRCPTNRGAFSSHRSKNVFSSSSSTA